MTETSNATEPLNPYPQQQPPPNYSATGPTPGAATGPTAPPSGTGLPHPLDSPPQYGEMFSDKPTGAGGGQQAYMMPGVGPAPMPGPGPAPMPGPNYVTTVNYQAGQSAVIASPMILSSFPALVTCPQCHLHVTTSVDYVAGTLTWLLALIMCFGFFLCCCLIPFFLDGCKDVVHSCPNCHHALGIYRRM